MRPPDPAQRSATPNAKAAVLSIGTFDGVHLGHRALIERGANIARAAGARVVALAFDPNPLEVLSADRAPARLTTWTQRERLLREAGANEVVQLTPTPELLALAAADFVEQVVHDHRPIAVVEGADFRFGAGRAGDIGTLRTLGDKHGFEVEVVDQVECALNDHTIASARSSVIRTLISHGRVSDAARLLGRPYAMTGLVRRGDRRGRTIGYPTANLDSPCLAPADGVYAGRARLPDGRMLAAAISVGTKPTFGTHARAVEAYLMECTPEAMDSDGEWAAIAGLPEYDWPMELEFLTFVRDQVKFDALDPLLSQMARDCAACWAVARCADDCETAKPGV